MVGNHSEDTMPDRPKTMTAKEFTAWLRNHELTAYAAAPILGISRQMAYRYAVDGNVSRPVAKLMDMIDRHGIPRDWR